jgi:hypothetical protein
LYELSVPYVGDYDFSNEEECVDLTATADTGVFGGPKYETDRLAVFPRVWTGKDSMLVDTVDVPGVGPMPSAFGQWPRGSRSQVRVYDRGTHEYCGLDLKPDAPTKSCDDDTNEYDLPVRDLPLAK